MSLQETLKQLNIHPLMQLAMVKIVGLDKSIEIIQYAHEIIEEESQQNPIIY